MPTNRETVTWLNWSLDMELQLISQCHFQCFLLGRNLLVNNKHTNGAFDFRISI